MTNATDDLSWVIERIDQIEAAEQLKDTVMADIDGVDDADEALSFKLAYLHLYGQPTQVEDDSSENGSVTLSEGRVYNTDSHKEISSPIVFIPLMLKNMRRYSSDEGKCTSVDLVYPNMTTPVSGNAQRCAECPKRFGDSRKCQVVGRITGVFKGDFQATGAASVIICRTKWARLHKSIFAKIKANMEKEALESEDRKPIHSKITDYVVKVSVNSYKNERFPTKKVYELVLNSVTPIDLEPSIADKLHSMHKELVDKFNEDHARRAKFTDGISPESSDVDDMSDPED